MGLHSRASQNTAELVHSASLLRSDGPLSTQDLAAARRAGFALDFDPVQNGWVRADAVDDFDRDYRRAGWRKAPAATDITFRPWVAHDAPLFRTLLNNPNVWTHLPNPFLGDITTQMASDLIALSADKSLHIVRAVCADGVPVGQVRLEFGGQEPELSYWLGESHWGKGIGRRAVTAFVAECFDADLTLDHMIARVKPENAGSLRILESAGFIREGRSNAAPDWIILRRDRSA